MTLAPNLQRRLNGSSFFLLILVLIIGISSCGGPKEVARTKPRTTKPVRKKPKSKAKVDTVKWTKVSKEEFPPITEESGNKETLDKKDSYKISLMIPFDAAKGNNLTKIKHDANVHRFVNYYAGVTLALEDLEDEGASLLVNVEDSKSTESIKSILNNSNNRDADMIIGPYSKNALNEAIDFGKKNSIPVVSPWRASDNPTDDNPYYVQLRPKLKQQYKKITESVLSKFSPDQVFLIGRDIKSDKARFKYFNQALREETGNPGAKFDEFLVEEDSLKLGETAFDSIFYMDKPTVFILPNWKGADEDFIYSCLRRMRVEKGMGKVFVFGMPILLESERIGYDYFKNLHLHVVRSKFVDLKSRAVQSFRSRYYNQFGALPTKDAYDGYDVMLYLGRMITKYGKNFQFFLDKDPEQMLQTTYQVEKVMMESDRDISKKNNVKFFENTYLDIIRFNGYDFVRDR